MSEDTIKQEVVNNQITRAKILSENLYDKLEQYSFMDITENFAHASRTMEVLVCARQLHDILENLYEYQAIDGLDSPLVEPFNGALADLLRKG